MCNVGNNFQLYQNYRMFLREIVNLLSFEKLVSCFTIRIEYTFFFLESTSLVLRVLFASTFQVL